MTHPIHPDFPELHIQPVHITNPEEIKHPPGGGGRPAGYPRSSWVTHPVLLFGQGVKPTKLLQSDERRGRATFMSIDQDIFVASTEAELVLSAGSQLPQGGYVPKGFEKVIYDSDELWAVSAQNGTTRVTVHAESIA